MCRRMSAISVVCLGLMLTVCSPAQQDGDAALSRIVSGFLETWLYKKDPMTAGAQHWSPLLTDERFVPPAAVPSEQIALRHSKNWVLADHPVNQAAFRKAMTQYLTQVQAGIPAIPLVDLLMPISLREDEITLDPNLRRILTERKARPLPGLPALAYRVSSPRDLAWLASGTVGYDVLLAGIMDRQQLNVQAVVQRLKVNAPPDAPFLLVTLWAEQARTPGNWKLVGVEVPSVH